MDSGNINNLEYSTKSTGLATISRLVRAWFWCHLLVIAAVVLQPTVPAILFGRYSKTSIVVLGTLIIVAPLVWIGSRKLADLLEKRRLTLSRVQAAALPICCVVALFVQPFFTNSVTASYMILQLYLDFILISLGMWALHSLVETSTKWRWIVYAGPVLGIGICVFALVVGTRFPGMQWHDVGLYFATTFGVLRTGRPLSLIWQPATFEITSLTYYGQAVIFRIFGATLETMQLYLLGLALLGLAFTFAAARRLYSTSAAWIAIILGAVVLLNDNYPRLEQEASVFIALALLLYVLAQQTGKRWLHFATGLAIVLSMDGHPSTYRFVIGFGLAYGLEYVQLLVERWRSGQRRLFIYWPLVLLILGGVLSFILYIGFWSSVTPYTFVHDSHSPFFAVSPNDMLGVLYNHFYTALDNGPLLFGSAMLAIVLVFRKPTQTERLIVVTLIVGALIMATLYGHYLPYYLITLVPMLSLLAAALYNRLEQALDATARRIVMAGVIVMVSAASLGWLMQKILSDQPYDEGLKVADHIRQIVPADAVFVGVDSFYPHMLDYEHYIDIGSYGFIRTQFNLDGVGVWAKANPSAIAIVDGFPVQEPSLRDYVVQRQFVLVQCWTTSQLGKVELFMQTAPPDLTPVQVCQPLS